jgi:hypothetical protein
VLLPVTDEIDASTVMWDFFRTRHSKAAPEHEGGVGLRSDVQRGQ